MRPRLRQHKTVVTASPDLPSAAQLRRQSEAKAREHVGAAGWLQSATLERIIRAGQEQLSATDTLRQVLALTLEQVRAAPLGLQATDRDAQAEALADLVASGEQQLSAAEALDRLIGGALGHVLQTPMHELNVRVLEQVHARVQRQLAALHAIIDAARAQAEGVQQLRTLEALSSAHRANIQAIAQLSADAEVAVLEDAALQSVGRIADLDSAREGQQLGALERIGGAAVERIAGLDAPAGAQVGALEGLAEAAGQKAQQLRAEGEG